MPAGGLHVLALFMGSHGGAELARTRKVGDHIPNSGYLRLENTYGQPSLYVSPSVFGVPGFGTK